MRTKDQRFSESCWTKVSDAKMENQLSDEYVSRARSFPALIHHAGLCQALAFLESKGPDLYKQHLQQVAVENEIINEGETLIEKSQTAAMPAYLVLTRRVMDIAQWLSRSVNALVEPDKNGGNNQ
jgi:CRISPR type III-B/RAMP module-associated protein Cmr5